MFKNFLLISRRKCRKISKSTSEIFGKFRELFRKVLRIESFRKVSKIILENFEIYLGKFWEILPKFLRIISKNFETNF